MNLPSFEAYKALTTNHKSSHDHPSRSDRYYEKVYHQFEQGKTYTWNWAAAIFSYTWLLYRKMYMAAFLYSFIIFLSSFFLPFLGLFLFKTFGSFLVKTLQLSSSSLGIFFGISIFLLFIAIILIFGFMGNKIYLRYIRKKADKQYHLASDRIKNTDKLISILPYLGGIIYFLTYLILFESRSNAGLDSSLGDISGALLIMLITWGKIAITCYLDRKKVKDKIEELSHSKPALSHSE